MNTHGDRDLEDAFEALGRLDREGIPSFRQMTSREALDAVRWRHRRRRLAFLVAAIAIPASFALLTRTDRALDSERFTALTGLDLGEVTWDAPSDFLLDFPGRDLLRRVPLIEIAAPVVAPDSSRPPDSNDTKRRSPS